MATQLTVGFIDDEPGLLFSFQGMLASYDYQTELYTSAGQFLDAAAASRAICLVVDINLGDISGIELGRHLAANGNRFPLIFMSGDKDEVLLRQADELVRSTFCRSRSPCRS
jgi:FixJ family two-component response regulator